MKSLLKSPYVNYFVLGFFLFLVTAFFNEGYHNDDEHFQILEFANFKLGHTPLADLPWEYSAGIRSSLQPFLAYLMIRFFLFLGLQNPFYQAFVLRLSCCFLSWFVFCKMSLLLAKNFSTEKERKIFIAMTLFLWFMPYLSVRFSSENMSGITFLWALYLVLSVFESGLKNKNYFIFFSGLLLGFAFYLRFQMGIAVAGLFCWLMFVRKMPGKDLFMLVFGGILAALVSTEIDYWFYGKLEITPCNYFNSNIVEGVAAKFGVSPWWDYFRIFITAAGPPFGALLLIFFIAGIYRKPLDVFTFCIIPFLLVHMMTGHKEMRFLFPLAYAFIYLSAIGLGFISGLFRQGKAVSFLIGLLLLVNFSLLLYRTFAPAKELICYYKFLYTCSRNKNVNLVCRNISPYTMSGYEMNFYKPKNIHVYPLKEGVGMNDYLQENKLDSVIFLNRQLAFGDSLPDFNKERIYTLLPAWVLKWNFNNWEERSDLWSIYRITRK